MQLYYLPIQEFRISETDSLLLKYLPLSRQYKFNQYKFDIDKKLLLYSNLLLRKCISTILHLPSYKVDIEQKEFQKPILINSKNVDFNYSHTHNAILLGISTYGKIGVDIEAISKHIPNDLHLFFHKHELAYIERAPKPQKAFYEIWTKKEAYTKYLGLGLSADLVSINTLSTSLKLHLKTWQQDFYICSVYSDKIVDSHIPLTTVTENDIKNFYLHQKYYPKK